MSTSHAAQFCGMSVKQRNWKSHINLHVCVTSKICVICNEEKMFFHLSKRIIVVAKKPFHENMFKKPLEVLSHYTELYQK